MGLALVRTGDRTQAERYFRQIERFPGSPYIEEARRRSGPNAALAPIVQYVLLGKFGRWESAERVRKDAGNAGFQAVIERVTSSDGTTYEVRVQVTGGRDDAVRTADALRGKGFSPTVVP
jgi:cell division protein FtsN